MKLADIKPNPDNPRTATKEDIEKLKNSIEDLPKMMKARPIVIKDGVIVGGNQRYNALMALGKTEIPDEWVFDAKDWTEKEIERFIVQDNVSSGAWDWDILANQYELEDLDAWGVELPEYLTEDSKEVEEDEAPEVNSEPPVSQVGVVYQLGRHFVMCGDSTDKASVELLMNGVKADMVFTDPPYGVSYASKNEYLNTIARGNRIQTPIENDHMDLEDTSEFIYQCFVNLRMILAEKSSYYITAPQGGDLLMMMMMMQKADLTLRHMLIWVKNNHVLGRTDYNYKHEPILFGWVNTHNFYGNGKHKFSTWEIDKPLKSDLHPTMKPVELIVNAIENSTLKDEIVADLFLGSGSTLIACEQTDRICYGIELDPKYVDVIRKRYAKFISPDNQLPENWEELTPEIAREKRGE